MPRLGRRRLDLPLARARALGYRTRAVHVHHGLRGAEADADAEHCASVLGAEVVRVAACDDRRQRCASSATRDRAVRAARDGPHRLRPGRDGALPARLERLDPRDQAASRRRRRAPAPAALARGDRGLLRRARLCRCARTRRTPTRSAASSATGSCRFSRSSTRAPARTCSRSRPSGPVCRGRSSARSSSSARRSKGPGRPISARGIRAVRAYDELRLEGSVSWGPWRLESDRTGLVVRSRGRGIVSRGGGGRCRMCSWTRRCRGASGTRWPLVATTSGEVVAVPGIAEAPGWEGAVRAVEGAVVTSVHARRRRGPDRRGRARATGSSSSARRSRPTTRVAISSSSASSRARSSSSPT